MKYQRLQAVACALLFCLSCRKNPAPEILSTPPIAIPGFQEFLIPKGTYYAIESVLKYREVKSLQFLVVFDSSAMYKTAHPENQYDINKLYGFSDNGGHHHQFSARLGWRWSDDSLRLFTYVYNNGVRDAKELGTVAIGDTARCFIDVEADQYRFAVNGRLDSILRRSKTDTARGYQLYPYFGGDEPAPHDVRIWIREEGRSRQ